MSDMKYHSRKYGRRNVPYACKVGTRYVERPHTVDIVWLEARVKAAEAALAVAHKEAREASGHFEEQYALLPPIPQKTLEALILLELAKGKGMTLEEISEKVVKEVQSNMRALIMGGLAKRLIEERGGRTAKFVSGEEGDELYSAFIHFTHAIKVVNLHSNEAAKLAALWSGAASPRT